MDRLNRCRACGEAPRLHSWKQGSGRLYCVECSNPRCQTRPVSRPMPAEVEAIREWNAANTQRGGGRAA